MIQNSGMNAKYLPGVIARIDSAKISTFAGNVGYSFTVRGICRGAAKDATKT